VRLEGRAVIAADKHLQSARWRRTHGFQCAFRLRNAPTTHRAAVSRNAPTPYPRSAEPRSGRRTGANLGQPSTASVAVPVTGGFRPVCQSRKRSRLRGSKVHPSFDLSGDAGRRQLARARVPPVTIVSPALKLVLAPALFGHDEPRQSSRSRRVTAPPSAPRSAGPGRSSVTRPIPSNHDRRSLGSSARSTSATAWRRPARRMTGNY
jgi:hypothetical protein